MSKVQKVQEQASIQREEAKRLINSALGFPDDIQSETVNQAVDYIISAAILEVAAIQAEAMAQRTESDCR